MFLESSGLDVEYSEFDGSGMISDDEILGYLFFFYVCYD